MEVVLTEIHSVRDAIRAMYVSKRNWTEEREETITNMVYENTDFYGRPWWGRGARPGFRDVTDKLFRIGRKHTTLLRFMDMSVTVRGLHRGAMDDFDSHAKRLENRIIRSSTRLSEFAPGEMSEWYKGKILPYDLALDMLGIEMPDELVDLETGKVYVKKAGGYVLKEYSDSKDARRGLYMLSIPCEFAFKCNLVEFAHIYRERGSADHGANGKAAPELQEMIEALADQLETWYPQVTREYLLSIRN